MMSAATAKQPTLTLLLVPTYSKKHEPGYMRIVRENPAICKHVTEIPNQRLELEVPHNCNIGLGPGTKPKWNYKLTVVGNTAGYTKHFKGESPSGHT